MTQLGMIGGGVMAEAILSRILAQGHYAPEDVVVSDPLPARRQWLQDTYGVQVTGHNEQAAQVHTLLLAIKPQVFPALAQELPPGPSDQLVLSILAGTPLAKLEAAFPGQAVVRAMPNTPATVGCAMTAIVPGQRVTPAQLQAAHQFFEAIGQVVQVPESLINAVTGLSGSGPAYVALLVEALADGGVSMGLPRAIAQQLALQTVRGTATLLQDTQLHPAELKDRVSSPGGTTIAGVTALEANGFRSALIQAVQAATARADALG